MFNTILNNEINKIINKGTGAGGANTNFNGIMFENKTSIENKLLENNFKKIIMNKNKYGYYYIKTNNENNKIIYLTQSGFQSYFKENFNFNIYKKPDEAFVILNNNTFYIKILEKKNQNVEGSVEDKLKTGLFNKKEYEKIFKYEIEKNNIIFNYNISYGFCISKFLQEKFESNKIKYNIIKEIMDEDGIKIFYGDNDNYFDILLNWVL